MFRFKEVISYKNVIFDLQIPTEDEEDPESDDNSPIFGGCYDSVSKMFDYDHVVIPPEQHFFTAGYISSKEDK